MPRRSSKYPRPPEATASARGASTEPREHARTGRCFPRKEAGDAAAPSSPALVHPERFLATLPRTQRTIARALRTLVRETVPEAAETVLWRSLSYHRPELGGRIKGAVCLITPKRFCAHLEFIHGARLPDPHRLLRGTRREKRFIPIYPEQALDHAPLRDLILRAARYEP